MPKNYAYIRISKDTSDAANQRHEIAAAFQVDEWTEEVVSGKTLADDRQLGALIEKLQPGDTIAAADISRLGRNTLDVIEVAARIRRHGARLVTVKGSFELNDSIASEAILFAYSISARIEREMISTRTKASLARLVAEGKVLGRPKGTTSTNATLAAHAADIATMRKNGVSAAAIARTHGVARDTVRKFLKEKGL